MANDITPKHEIYNTGIELHEISGWSRHTVADGKWLNINTIKPVSADLNILASAIHDTSGALQDDVDYLSANIDNLSGELYDTSSYLNEEIIKINARADVTDVVGTYAEFESLSASAIAGTYNISDRDIIKVLDDEQHNNRQSYYRYLSADPYNWEDVGDLEPYYNNKSWSDGSNNHGILELNNTNSIRNFKLGVDNYVEFVKKSGVDEYDFRLNEDFINSASEAYDALSSISGINDGTLEGDRVNHKVSNYSLAQGSANSATNDSFAQGKKNTADNQSFAQGYNITATDYAFGQGKTVNSEEHSFGQGENITASYTAFGQGIGNEVTGDSFAQGISNTAYTEGFTQGSGNIAEINSFAQGKGNSANHDAFTQGLSVIASAESLAQGQNVTAKNRSFAQGVSNSADERSLAQGYSAYAYTDSLAQGNSVTAKNNSLVQGVDSSAKDESFAQGSHVTAFDDAFAQGEYLSAGERAFAQGDEVSSFHNSLAQGYSASAYDDSLAQGDYVTAGSIAMAQGRDASAYYNSFVQGKNANADMESFAQGYSAFANEKSLAQGYKVIANDYSFAQGESNTVNVTGFAQGKNNKVSEDDDNFGNTFAQGSNNIADYYSLAQGYSNTAIGHAFAQGKSNKAGNERTIQSFSFAQGSGNNAGLNSFAQGKGNNASLHSLAQGSGNSASNESVAIGWNNNTDRISFAHGISNTANGYSILQGSGNSAKNYGQAFGQGLIIDGGMAIGKFNKTTDARFVIGNGTNDNNRSDLYWINQNGDVYTEGDISATNFYIDGSPINSVVSAKFSAYNGATKVGEFPISSFNLKANTDKYISATTAANTMIFSVSDSLINSASSGYQAKEWVNTNGDGVIGSAKSGAAASAWIKDNSTRIDDIENSAKSGYAASAWIKTNSTRIDNIENSAKSGYAASAWIKTTGDNIIGSANSGAAASAYIATNGVGTKVGGYDQYGFYQYNYLVIDPITRGLYTDPNDLTTPIGYYVPIFDSADSGKVLIVNDTGDRAWWDYPDPAGSSEVEIEVGETGGYTKIVNAISAGNTPVLVKTGQYGGKERYIFTERLNNGAGYRFVKPDASSITTRLYTYTVQTGDIYDSDNYDSIPKPAAATSGNIAIFDSSRRVIDSEHGFSDYASGNVKTMAYNDVFPTSQQIKRDDTNYAYMYIGNTVKRIALGITSAGNVRLGEEKGGTSSPSSANSIIWSNGTGDSTKYHFNGSALGATNADSAKYASTANSAYSAYYATSAISAYVALSAENSVRLGGKPANAYALVSGTYTASTGLKVYSAIYANDSLKWNGYELVFNRLPTQGANEISFM